ncbi:MAG TPA: hypothetical protein VHK47_21255 [Polyangia bacterium]|jgi:hypothetical protein|nr:hypothetical protein [Polyangia bacterium]
MIRDDETSEKTPSTTLPAPDAAKTPPRPLALVPRRPPPGRPSSSVSISELVERITRDVWSTTEGELERRQGQLRDELRGELVGGVRLATGFGVAAIVMNVVALVAIVVVKLASLPALPSGGVSLAVAALVGLTALTGLTAMFFGAAKAGLRRPQSAR